MSPIQQMLLGVGAVAKKTYIDDIFSTFLYRGSGSARQIVNGIDLSGEGGLVWIKNRDASDKHILGDTVRGVNKYLSSNLNAAETNDGSMIMNSHSNAFSVGAENEVNTNGEDYSSWTFRKAPGFFDIQEYSSGSSNTSGSIGNANFQVNHDLGCIPGMILIKRTNSTNDWFAWVRGKEGVLNSSNALDDATALPLADVTSTYFKFSAGNGSYNDPGNFIAYIFAGGESGAATARSVFFDGDDDRLTLAATSDFAFGTGDFTIECWARRAEDNDNYSRLVHFGPYWNNDDAVGIMFDDGDHANKITFGSYRNANQGDVPSNGRILVSKSNVYSGQWYHVAVTRSSGVFRLFINGMLEDTDSSITSRATEASATNTMAIAGTVDRMVSEPFDGDISNVRVIKGTALYTSSFSPPTEPLTNVTNTKLLCCNNSSTTGSTVTPGTITADGSPIAKTDSPFVDSNKYVFGENEDQEIIKCGSYVGNSVNDGPEINLGWEPQWIMIKDADRAENWILFDSMRGIVDGASDKYLYPNTNAAEAGNNLIKLTPTGFKIVLASDEINYDGAANTYIYMAVRRPDGYVGKPPELGTSVFVPTLGNGSATIPSLPSTFPVDFCLYKDFVDSTANWATTARLTGGGYMQTNTTNAEASTNEHAWDSMVGCHAGTWLNSNDIGYLWKRHAGFDVVTFVGNEVSGRQIPHSLNKVPEMMWVKNRSSANKPWNVYHKGLNGGSNPQGYYIELDNNQAEDTSNTRWNSTAPTSTHFTLGNSSLINTDGENLIAMLFASVDGISKVGYYTGTGGTRTITTGFQPRFLIYKKTSSTQDWFVLDTTRGWGSGDDKYLELNNTNDQDDFNFGAPTSTGFTLEDYNNTNGATYIYYAHA